jgi:YidC/Oxa1 family membrane protein insertase
MAFSSGGYLLEKVKSEESNDWLGPDQGPSVRRIRFVTILIFLLIIVLFSLSVSGVLSITEVWNRVVFEPMLNLLILMAHYLGRNLGLSIVFMTILVRVITLPLAVGQLKASKLYQEQIRPKVEELRKTYEKDTVGLRQKVAELYREWDYNPLGCLFTTIVQFPLWYALYWCVAQTLSYLPENRIGLSTHLYPWSLLRETLPLNGKFLWLNLAQTSIVLAILTFATLWMAQQMSPQPPAEYRRRTSKWGQFVLPALFGLFALVLPSGLTLYWVSSSIIQIIIQYRVTGWGALKVPFRTSKRPQEADKSPTNSDIVSSGEPESKERGIIEQDRDVGEDKGKTPQ